MAQDTQVHFIVPDFESVRRVFLSNYKDPESGEWSYEAFALRDHPSLEDSLSVVRVKFVSNYTNFLKQLFHEKKLKKVCGYVETTVKDINAIKIKGIEQQVRAETETHPHAGIHVWENGNKIEGSIDSPAMLRFKKALFELTIDSFTEQVIH